MKNKYFLVFLTAMVLLAGAVFYAHPVLADTTQTFGWSDIYGQTYPGVPPYSQGGTDGSFYADNATANKVCQLKGFTSAVSFITDSYTSCGDNFYIQWNGSAWTQFNACQSNLQLQTLVCTKPSCTANSSQKCVGNAVYNFDSCGNQGSLAQQCTASQTCQNAQCVDINVNSTCTSNPILATPGLSQIIFYEQTSGPSNPADTYAFSVSDPRLTQRIQEDAAHTDFGPAAEPYDVFISDANGNLNPNGSYITIEANFQAPVQAPYLNDGAGNNIDSVELLFSDGTKIYASKVAKAVTGDGLSGQFLTQNGFVTRALGAPDMSSTRMGINKSSMTIGFCNPAGNITCSKNSDCGTNGFVGNPFCQGNNVYQNFKTFTCNNPGTPQSSCSNSTAPKTLDNCKNGETCKDGECVQKQCKPDWQTSDWSACSNGWQTRTATDMNHCGDDSSKPVCSQSCNSGSGGSGNCVWLGHCQGDPCQTFDDCDGNLVCNSGKCGPIGGGGNPPPTCTPSWQTSSWSTCSNGQQTRTATDMNHCGDDSSKPVCSQSCNSGSGGSGNCVWLGHCQGDPCQTFDDCDGNLVCNSGKCGPIGGGNPICTSNWQTGAWSTCSNGQQTRTVTDSNNCGTFIGMPAGTQSCSSGGGSGTSFDQGMVSFTFDDGWQSAYQNGIPLLDKYGLKSTEYIISGEVGDTANGYMTLSQILDLQSRGHEIEAHTKTHTDLTTVTPSQLIDEVAGSKSDLEAMGVNTITSFDYPYGSYNNAVEQAVKNAGYLSARTVDFGDNQKGDDPYLLKAMVIDDTTTVAQVEQRIDAAVANKTWLILLIHQVDNLGNQYDIAPTNLSQIVDYINQNNIKTVKVSEGLAQM